MLEASSTCSITHYNKLQSESMVLFSILCLLKIRVKLKRHLSVAWDDISGHSVTLIKIGVNLLSHCISSVRSPRVKENFSQRRGVNKVIQCLYCTVSDKLVSAV